MPTAHPADCPCPPICGGLALNQPPGLVSHGQGSSLRIPAHVCDSPSAFRSRSQSRRAPGSRRRRPKRTSRPRRSSGAAPIYPASTPGLSSRTCRAQDPASASAFVRPGSARSARCTMPTVRARSVAWGSIKGERVRLALRGADVPVPARVGAHRGRTACGGRCDVLDSAPIVRRRLKWSASIAGHMEADWRRIGGGWPAPDFRRGRNLRRYSDIRQRQWWLRVGSNASSAIPPVAIVGG